MIPITLYAQTLSKTTTEDDIKLTTTVTPTPIEVETLPTITITPIEVETATTYAVKANTYAAVAAIKENDLKVHTLEIMAGDTEVNISRLMDIYYLGGEYGRLNRDDDALINTCIDFLYNQLGMNNEVVAGIIGNVCNEGHFGEEQGTYKLASNVDEYISNLSSSTDKGYGIAQWTYQDRQDKLAAHTVEIIDYLVAEYGLDYEACMYGEYYPTVIVTSELTFLYEELNGYGIFEDFNKEYTLEDATGRIALSYERYKNSKKHWEYGQDGKCYLIGSSECSGAERLKFAELIYEKLNN